MHFRATVNCAQNHKRKQTALPPQAASETPAQHGADIEDTTGCSAYTEYTTHVSEAIPVLDLTAVLGDG